MRPSPIGPQVDLPTGHGSARGACRYGQAETRGLATNTRRRGSRKERGSEICGAAESQHRPPSQRNNLETTPRNCRGEDWARAEHEGRRGTNWPHRQARRPPRPPQASAAWRVGNARESPTYNVQPRLCKPERLGQPLPAHPRAPRQLRAHVLDSKATQEKNIGEGWRGQYVGPVCVDASARAPNQGPLLNNRAASRYCYVLPGSGPHGESQSTVGHVDAHSCSRGCCGGERRVSRGTCARQTCPSRPPHLLGSTLGWTAIPVPNEQELLSGIVPKVSVPIPGVQTRAPQEGPRIAPR